MKHAVQATCTGETLSTNLTILSFTRWKVSLLTSPSKHRKCSLTEGRKPAVASNVERHCVLGRAGVKVLDPEQYSDAASGGKVAEKELKDTLEGLAEHLFGQGIEASLLTLPLNCLLECKHDTG